MFKEKKKVTYQFTAEGTWGEFTTPAGKVSYLMTKARLGKPGTDNERKLTSQLRPVREVLEPESLDFSQLLQRDLDDHRVATQLIPYLLKQKFSGPAFFPPIMAVILPFEGNKTINSFPEAVTLKEPFEEDGVSFQVIEYGQAFRIQRLVHEDGDLHHIKLGRVSWNEEFGKLVVLDGQHRAMALIAIDRTLSSTWGDKGRATRYSFFYEHRIKSLIEEAEKNGESVNLDDIEFPVIICWFPEQTGVGKSPHKAARKLFVDVNKEARRPSNSRLILLSDTELINIFTRALLNRLRESDPPFPLYAIEYDNPDIERESFRPSRWSVIANLNLLKFATQYTVFGPRKYIQDVKKKVSGKLPWLDMNLYMREQLELKSFLPKDIEDEERSFDRDTISNENFPLKNLDELTDRFTNTWGKAILTVLGQLKPYKAHCEALIKMKDEWITDNAMSSLAREAIFIGAGLYWTLKDSHNHWLKRIELCKDERKPIPSKPEIVKAWNIIEEKKNEFYKLRSRFYFRDVKVLKDSEEFFQIVNTHACQIGAILALATLIDRFNVEKGNIGDFAETIVISWNKVLEGTGKNDERRLLIFSRDIPNPINKIKKLDTPLAVYFRYFWLELLGVEARKNDHLEEINQEDLLILCEEARSVYLAYLFKEQKNDLKRTYPEKDETVIKNDAWEIVTMGLKSSLISWFEFDSEYLESWILSERPKYGLDNAINKDSDDNLDEYEGEESDDAPESADDLLKKIDNDFD